MQSQHLELSEYLPPDWQLCPTRQGLRLVAPSADDASLFFQGAGHYLKQSADYIRAAIEVVWEGCNEPLRVEGPTIPSAPSINSYGPSIIAPHASYAEAMDFIAGKQAEGLIVTVMAMGSDRFLFVNGAQVADRGGNAETWIGVDAKALVWHRSLTGTLPGREKGVNYYARLHELLERDRQIPDFSYCVTRPNGDLHRDVSTYFYIENYLGVPARIAVSRVGDSELVEAAKL
ncbi:MAG: hypothetical protein IGS50_12495 [Synechococcales cyanobacterium C42_A2020_086]|nr:hypothetical protein [Synechococcales cyanobacterium C42_A2020_086]